MQDSHLPQIRKILTEHLGSPVTVTPLHPEAYNLIFSVECRQAKYILKLYPAGSFEERVFELELLCRLSGSDSSTAFPVAALDEVLTIADMPAILFELIRGRSVRPEDITPSFLRKLAAVQAVMHSTLMSANLGHKERFNPLSFDYLEYFNFHTDDQTLLGIVDAMKTQAADLDADGMLETIIHDDLSVDNVLIDSSHSIHIIDFDDAHKSLRISDIGTAVKEFIVDHHGVNDDSIRKYLEAYTAVNTAAPLSDAELNALPFMIKRRALFMYAYYSSRLEKPQARQRAQKQLQSLLLTARTPFSILSSAAEI